jgi:hypothetical protein
MTVRRWATALGPPLEENLVAFGRLSLAAPRVYKETMHSAMERGAIAKRQMTKRSGLSAIALICSMLGCGSDNSRNDHGSSVSSA